MLYMGKPAHANDVPLARETTLVAVTGDLAPYKSYNMIYVTDRLPGGLPPHLGHARLESRDSTSSYSTTDVSPSPVMQGLNPTVVTNYLDILSNVQKDADSRPNTGSLEPLNRNSLSNRFIMNMESDLFMVKEDTVSSAEPLEYSRGSFPNQFAESYDSSNTKPWRVIPLLYTPHTSVSQLYRALTGYPIEWWVPSMREAGVPGYMINKVVCFSPSRTDVLLRRETKKKDKIYGPPPTPRRVPTCEPPYPTLADGCRISLKYARWAAWKFNTIERELQSLINDDRTHAKRGYIHYSKTASLLMHANLSERQMKEFLPSARIELQYHDSASYSYERPNITLGDYFPVTFRVIPLLGGISSLEEWNRLQKVFSKHKPIWRTGIVFLEGHLDEEETGKFFRSCEKLKQRYPQQFADPETDSEHSVVEDWSWAATQGSESPTWNSIEELVADRRVSSAFEHDCDLLGLESLGVASTLKTSPLSIGGVQPAPESDIDDAIDDIYKLYLEEPVMGPKEFWEFIDLADLEFLTRTRYQGAGPSTMNGGTDPSKFWHVQHHHTVPVEFLRELHSLMETIGDFVDEKCKPMASQFVSRFVALLLALGAADTWTQYLTAFIQFCAGGGYFSNPLETISRLMQQLFPSRTTWRVTPPFSGMKYQSGEDRIPDNGEALPGWFIGEFIASIWHEFAGAVSSIPELTREVISSLLTSMRISMVRTVGTNMAQYVLECITFARDRILQAIRERDISILFTTRTPPLVLIRHARGVRDNYAKLVCPDNKMSRDAIAQLVAQGDIPSWIAPGSFEDWVKRALTISSELAEACRYVSAIDSLRNPLVAAKNELDRFISAHQSGRTTRSRIQPAYFYFHGVPGCGKSHFSEHVVLALQKGLGKEYGLHNSGASVASYGAKENFQSNIKPETWCVKFDDVDAYITKPDGGSLDAVQYMMKMADTMPFENESAIAEEKGGNYIEPLVMLQTSNFPDSCAKDSLKMPEALFRRMSLRFRVMPDDEFATTPDAKGQSRLKTSKAEEAATFDTLKMYVDKFVDGEWKEVARNVRVSQALRMITDYCVRWWAREKRRIESFGTNEVCDSCYLPLSKSCSCQKPDEPVDYSCFPPELPENPPPLVGQPVYQARIGACNWSWPTLKMPEWIVSVMDRSYARQFADGLLKATEMLVEHAGKVAFALGLVITMGTAYVTKQARVHNATEVSPGFIRADGQRPYFPSFNHPSTWTCENMIDTVKENFITVTNPKTGGTVYGVTVSCGIVLIPTHIAQPGETITLRRSNEKNGRELTVRLVAPNYVLLPDPELMLVRQCSLPSVRDITKFFTPAPDTSISAYDEVVIFGPEGEVYRSTKVSKRQFDVHVRLFADVLTKDGDCGMLYATRHGSAWKISGMHYAQLEHPHSENGVLAMASMVCSLTVRRAIEQELRIFVMQSSLVKSCFTLSGQEPCTVNYERNSNVWNAITAKAQLHAYGKLYPALHGISPKTKIVPSLLYNEVLEAFPEVGPNDFGPPDFKTYKDPEDEIWKNPIFHALQTCNNVDFDDLDIICMYDYLSDFYETDFHGYGVLSVNDSITGLPGSYLHGINLTTSIGPPGVGSKSKHIDIFADEAFITPLLKEQICSIETILDRGDIPQVMATMTLKDEVLRQGKQARAFYNLPAAANIVAKRYLGPVRAFLQANSEISECMVGIDMTSSGSVNTLANRLNRPGYYYYDMDAKALDRTVNGASLFKVAVVFSALARLLSCDGEKAFAMIMMMRESLVNVTGDLVNLQCNLSGHDSTVQVNSIAMSLGERKIWYLLNPLESMSVRAEAMDWWRNFKANPIPFRRSRYRERTTLVTYGDDMIIATLDPRPPEVTALWKQHLGYDVTDGAKQPEISPKKFGELVFLKRKFVFWPEYNLYVAPLDLKSIIKMMLFKKTRTLSEVDHMADLLNAAALELVYHGEQQFSRIIPLVELFLRRWGPNAYLRVQDHKTYLLEIVAGNFRTWRVDDPHPINRDA